MTEVANPSYKSARPKSPPKANKPTPAQAEPTTLQLTVKEPVQLHSDEVAALSADFGNQALNRIIGAQADTPPGDTALTPIIQPKPIATSTLATVQRNEKVNINDDPGLEREADVMGQKALSHTPIQTVSPSQDRGEVGSADSVQRQDGAATGQSASTAPKANQTGLPDRLKTGVESMSGYSLDDVQVHYNSPKPALIHAHAYAQGTDIHVAPGQEKHLPHEAWHVVQQKQGRVKPTMQLSANASALETYQDALTEPTWGSTMGSPQGSSTAQRLMTEKEFIESSDSWKSGTRNRVLKVDAAVRKFHGASSKSVALTAVIEACNEYLDGKAKKDAQRVTGVKALRVQATQELAQWRLRERMPLPDSVYRSDERLPEIIAKVGFQPWNPDGDITIIEHVKQSLAKDRAKAPTGESGKKGQGAKKHSQFVSTAGTMDSAADPTLVAGLLNKVFYKIDSTLDPNAYTDVNKHFDEAGVPNPYELQYEFIHEGGIPGNCVTHFVLGKDLVDLVLSGAPASSWNIPWKTMPEVPTV